MEIFFVLFIVGYLNTILITYKNQFLKDPLDLGNLMRWVGCWFHMLFWVGIPERSYWWSVTPPVMHIGSPFCLEEFLYLPPLGIQTGKCGMRMDYFI